MDAKRIGNNMNLLQNYISADLQESWHIPRPTLARSSHSSQGSSSTNSTHSARSGSLLLTAANLALIHDNATNAPPATTKTGNAASNLQYYISSTQRQADPTDLTSADKKAVDNDDSASVASSTHFTVVNMNTSRAQAQKRSFCRKHQLTILVVTMSVLFTCGILAAILLMELRARNQQM